MKAVMSLDDASAGRDANAYFDFLETQPGVAPKKFGCVGYCMGGGLAVGAACMHPDRVAVAASFHGGRFVVDPASPEIIATKAKAPIYIGVAEVDRRHNAEVSTKLEDALTRAGVRHTIELYPGSHHGFAVPDVPAYDRTSAERHWERLFAFFGAAFAKDAS
jgi:carboxymethylenebutenolidase